MAAENFLKNLKKGLQNGGSCGILIKLTCAAEMNIRVWRSLVSRLNGVQEALSSNLNTRTTENPETRMVSGFFVFARQHEKSRSSNTFLTAAGRKQR